MDAKRIGLIADLHSHAPGAGDLPDAVLQAFRGVELIIPVGDIGEAAALDRLETVAPVHVVVYAATHQHLVSEHGGVLFVNPGSPTYSESKSVAILEIRDGKASAEVVAIA